MKVGYGSGRELVRCALDVVSVQVVRGCKEGAVRGGVLFYCVGSVSNYIYCYLYC